MLVTVNRRVTNSRAWLCSRVLPPAPSTQLHFLIFGSTAGFHRARCTSWRYCASLVLGSRSARRCAVMLMFGCRTADRAAYGV
jgi:hypothetical protein